MKKALLLYRINRDDPGNIGVINKIKAQNNAFKKLGFETNKIWLCKEGILKNNTLIHPQKLIPHSFGIYLFYFFQFGPLISKLINIKEYDFIYLRHPFFDPLLVRLLKEIKRKNKKVKIVLEINAYPYDAEPTRFLHLFSLRMDQHYRKKAKEYIDLIVHYGTETEIWGIPALPIRNGVDVDQIQVSIAPEKGKDLKLIAVGNWSRWHALDRILKGLRNYYEKGERTVEIYMTIVGNGEVKEELINMVEEYKLTKNVRFLPATSGKELEQFFDDAHIGIGSLGLYRTGIVLSSSLKNREYCSRGIPFILSAQDLDFPPELPFVYYVSNDETVLNIEDLLELFLNWRDQISRKEIRKYAEEHLTWEKQLLPVVKWLEKGEIQKSRKEE